MSQRIDTTPTRELWLFTERIDWACPYESRHTRACPGGGLQSGAGFLKPFLSHVALGRFGPNRKSFFSTFFNFVGIRVVYFNMFVLKHIHSFKLWSLGNQDNPCSECRTVYLLCVSTFKRLALKEVWWRASFLWGYELHEMQRGLSNVLLNTK